jgi:hypothetical protein
VSGGELGESGRPEGVSEGRASVGRGELMDG